MESLWIRRYILIIRDNFIILKKHIAILGSTGSIGTQALDVIRAHSNDFEVEVLTAWHNAPLLIQQAREFLPDVVVIGEERFYTDVVNALADLPIKVYAGKEAIEQVVEMGSVDLVLMAIVGFAALKPTLNAINSKKQLAIANKETFVVAGEIVTQLALENHVPIYPVDSEHSAIFQCLSGELHNPVHKIYLTASGGPFRGCESEFLRNVTREQALNHPNWSMGNKVTIDSASLMNKGLEVIEARWLFDLNIEQIDVIVHPQSVIHSMVEFEDGSIKAQMGMPDMRVPIQYALSYPRRLPSNNERFNFIKYPELTFEPVRTEVFRNLELAFDALKQGGNMPCVLNAANEIAVEAFLQKKIGFLQMSDVIEKSMKQIPFQAQASYDDYVATNNETRKFAASLV